MFRQSGFALICTLLYTYVDRRLQIIPRCKNSCSKVIFSSFWGLRPSTPPPASRLRLARAVAKILQKVSEFSALYISLYIPLKGPYISLYIYIYIYIYINLIIIYIYIYIYIILYSFRAKRKNHKDSHLKPSRP